MSKLTHLDEEGRASMVDVSAKASTERAASAGASVFLSEKAYALVIEGNAPKGDVLGTARIAGIMAAKKTSELIPLCHPLALSHVSVEFTPNEDDHSIAILATAKTTGPTGVEMEALTAASVAALTVYDMIKAVDRTARIEAIRLLAKSGGKSGTYEAEPQSASSASPAPRRSAPSPVRARADSPRSKTTPRVLVHEVAAAKPAAAPASIQEREAMRAFMMAKRLQPVEWAKSAGVPLNEIYGFLNGRSRALPKDVAEKLARAANARIEEMLGK